MVYTVLEILPLVFLLGWFWIQGLARIGIYDAIAYWLHPVHDSREFTESTLVIRYLRETYGSGIYSSWCNAVFLATGIAGTLLFTLIVFAAIWFAYSGSPVPVSMNELVLLAATLFLIPILVLRLAAWRKPLRQRRVGAIKRIFGDVRQAKSFAESVRHRRKKTGTPSVWSFPMGDDGWISRFDASVSLSALNFLLVVFFQAAQADKPSYLLFAVAAVVMLLVLPVNITGFCMAFGAWKETSDMTYPISLFLDDIAHLPDAETCV